MTKDQSPLEVGMEGFGLMQALSGAPEINIPVTVTADSIEWVAIMSDILARITDPKELTESTRNLLARISDANVDVIARMIVESGGEDPRK